MWAHYSDTIATKKKKKKEITGSLIFLGLGRGELSQQEIGGQSKTEVVEQKLASIRWGEEEREKGLGEKGDGEKKNCQQRGEMKKGITSVFLWSHWNANAFDFTDWCKAKAGWSA